MHFPKQFPYLTSIMHPNTIRRHRYVIGRFCKFTGITDLNEVTEAKCRALFYYGRTERKWSVNTSIVYQVTLLVFFSWCVTQSYMADNPIEAIELPKLEKKLPVRLSMQSALHL